MTNDDLATFLETSDEWIVSRTGISERRVSHVGTSELATVAARNALAAADLDPNEIDLIIVGTCTADEIIPNVASAVQQRIGAKNAAAFESDDDDDDENNNNNNNRTENEDSNVFLYRWCEWWSRREGRLQSRETTTHEENSFCFRPVGKPPPPPSTTTTLFC